MRIRRTLDADGNTIGTWQYRRELYPPQPWDADGDPRPTELRTHVEDPDGFCTKHYFDANPRYLNPPSSSGPDPGAFYGLPLSWDEPTSNGRQLSTQVYDGQDAFGFCSGNLIRSTYVTYGHDVLPGAPSTPVGPILEGLHDTNRRVEATRTLYHDDGDRFAETVLSDFDGLGHYRTSTTSGNFDAGNIRTTTTNFNPSAGSYPGSFTHPSVGSLWVLDTFDEREVTEGTDINRETFCFDAFGFMTRRRSFEDDSAPIGEKAVDVVSEFQRNGVGNLRFERYYGGDVQAMDTGTDLCTISLSSPQYELEHQYMFGAREFTRYLDSGPGGNLKLFEHVIDPSTGLVASTDDPAGITIDYTYDTLGRRTREQPEPGHGARVDIEYTNATPTTKAQLDIIRRPNGGGAALAQDRIVFDDLGRVFEEQQLLPSGSFNVRQTLYNARGLRQSISETEGGSPSHLATFSEYDAFGRPGRITPPDGAAHDVVLTYTGVSEVARTVMVQGDESEFASTTTETFDRQGRLYQVAEPSGSGGVMPVTTYEYDAGNRLEKVSMTDGVTTQERFFNYDGRGFLESEQHPEKGATGNGTVLYKNYDARGHTGRKEDGAAPTKNDLTFTYDLKERLTEVRETGGAMRTLKEFEYGTSGLAKGKVLSATRHNYLSEFSNNDLQIREIYTYNGVGGRISKRQTERTDIASGGGVLQGPTVWFETDFSWTELGDLASTVYPGCLIPTECTAGGNPSGQPARTVTRGYTNGFLSSVPGFAPTITYHPNEVLATIGHINGVTDEHDPDPTAMRRPAAIRTTGVTGGSNFDSGGYQYDGAGNVKSIGGDSFSYDGVSRLVTGSTMQGTFFETSSYDAFGNRVAAMTAPVGARAISADPATNRVLGTAERPVVYDSRGNQTLWGTAFYTFDGFDQMVLHEDADPGIDESFVYTADDERIVAIDNPTPSETWYLRDLNGQVLRKFFRLVGDTDWQRDTIRRQGLVLATDTVGLGLQHAHLDHLGTIRLWTRPDKTIASRHDYTAFGEEVVEPILPGANDYQYTGHERDIARSGGCSGTTTVDNQTIDTGQTFTGCDVLSSNNTTVTSADEVRFKAGESVGLSDFTVADGATFVVELDGGLNSDLQDLDYMHARYCSPVTGRFLSVDPVLQPERFSRSPQRWNRYSYVANSPLRFVDQTGEALILFNADNLDDAQRELAGLQQIFEEAGAAGEAELLDLTVTDGEIEVTSSGVDLSGSENKTVATIGRAISGDNRIEFDITSSLTTVDGRSLLERNGAAVQELGAGTPRNFRVELNPGIMAFTLGEVVGGPLQGRRTVTGYTTGDRVIHEFGHAFSAIDLGVFTNRTDSAAVNRYENEHRKLRGRQEGWIRSVTHN
ncbi:MAG: RHS repeat domain-containing protein [Gemmatimonadota bacterium]